MIDDAEIEILVVDDYSLVRRSVSRLLSSASSLKVVGQAADGREALQQIQTLRPTVVVMDIKMPEMDGLEVARRVQEQELPVMILFLTLHNSVQSIRKALQHGARGYVLKRFAGQELIAAVRKVARGEIYLGHGLESDAKEDEQTGGNGRTARR
jgi:DNA-binding NarL/FixJ family response regulator